MDSFKPKIIVLGTFSIVILYMITPVYTNTRDLMYKNFHYCKDNLETDKFETNLMTGTNHITYAENPIECFHTPYSKVYHQILNVHKVYLYPIEFCLWINNCFVYPHRDLSEIFKNATQELKTYMYTDFCLWDLNQDHITLDNSMDYAQQSIEHFNTPHGKAYHMILNNYRVDMNANYFCLWINEDAYKDHTEIWKHLIQDLTINAFIGSFPNLHENLCLYDIRRDRFTMHVEDNNSVNLTLAQEPPENFTTRHGSAYQSILYFYKSNMDPNCFCSWLYGNFDHNDLWRYLKGQIAFYTCIDQLHYDGFIEGSENDWQYSLAHVKSPSTHLKTWHGNKYRDILLEREPSPIPYQTTNMYCEIYRQVHEAHILPPN